MQKNNFSILYVEDNKSIRTQYVKLLQLYFENIYEAHDGDEALIMYKNYQPHIVILDINIPKKNGLKVAQEIREQNEDVILIILSAYSDKDKLLQAIELKLKKYLIKPIKTFEFENILLESIRDLKKKKEEKDIIFLSNGYKWSLSYEQLFSSSNEVVKLTKKELLLIKLFCENPNRTYSNNEIIDFVWEDQEISYNTNKLRILFSKLKTKLSHNLFSSTYNVGYKIILQT